MKFFRNAAYFIITLLCAMPAQAVTIDLNTDSDDKSVFDGHIDENTPELVLNGHAPAALLRHIPDLAPQLQKLDMRNLVLTPSAIEPYCFTGSGMTSVTLPQEVTTIGEGAFAGSAVETVEWPENLDSIAGHAFRLCTKLKSSQLPVSVRTIGRDAFSGCAAIQISEFPAAIEKIGNRAFAGTGITVADMTDCKQLKQIGDFAFFSCPVLEKAILPSHNVAIGNGAFMSCPAMTEINVHTETVPPLMLAASTAVESLSFLSESNVTNIGSHAFSGVKSVTCAELPATLEYIGDNAMERMYGLTAIDATKLEYLPELGENVWESTPQGDISLHTTADMADIFRNAAQWGEFRIIPQEQESGIDQLPDDTAGPTLAVDGHTLHITAPGHIERVTAHDIDGRIMHDMPYRLSPQATIDISDWEIPGAYIVRVYRQNLSATTHPIIIKNNR